MPQPPRLIYGTIKDRETILPYRKVKITNDTNGSVINTVSDSDGKYLVDAGNFSGGYNTGDPITVSTDAKSDNFEVEVRYYDTDTIVRRRKLMPEGMNEIGSWADHTPFGCAGRLEVWITNAEVNGNYSLEIIYNG